MLSGLRRKKAVRLTGIEMQLLRLLALRSVLHQQNDVHKLLHYELDIFDMFQFVFGGAL